MIKNIDVPEFHNQEKTTENFKDIRPNAVMSELEVDDFWTSEFSSSQDELRSSDFDIQLSEIFDCSEEEINIDYEIDDNIKNALERFDADNWAYMDEPYMLEAMEELKEVVADKLGIENAPSISIYEANDGNYGFYDAKDNTININRNYIVEPREVVNTLIHELRHAYQHFRAGIFETREDAMYKENFDNYISPIPLGDGSWLFFMDYLCQYVEVDARAFANYITEAMDK